MAVLLRGLGAGVGGGVEEEVPESVAEQALVGGVASQTSRVAFLERELGYSKEGEDVYNFHL